MGKLIDLTGRTFTRLKVIKRADKPVDVKNQHAYWLCKCDCGNEVIVDCSALLRGNTKSCGCYSADSARNRLLNIPKGTPRRKNMFVDCGEYYKGYTMKGEEFLFDKEMFETVSRHYWRANKGYIFTSADDTTSNKYIFLHHLVIGKPEKGMEVDHINRNRSDNREQNLRIVTHLQNMQNLSMNKTNTTGFTNIYYDGERNKYFGRFRFNKKIYGTAYFDNIEDAKKAVMEKMKVIKGDCYGKE